MPIFPKKSERIQPVDWGTVVKGTTRADMQTLKSFAGLASALRRRVQLEPIDAFFQCLDSVAVRLGVELREDAADVVAVPPS